MKAIKKLAKKKNNHLARGKGESAQEVFEDPLAARLQAKEAEMPPAMLRVAHYISRNKVAVLANSAAELAGLIGTSDATVIRTVQALGFQGLAELRQSIATNINFSAPLHHMRQTLDEVNGKGSDAADIVIDTHSESLTNMQTPEAREQIHKAIAVLHGAARIIIYAAGPSRPLAEYVRLMMVRHGQAAKVIGNGGIGLADELLDFSERDKLLVLSYGKPYKEVLLVAAEAAIAGVPVVLVTDSPNSKLARAATTIVKARRGRTSRVALHGATLVALEALVMGLAVAEQARTMQTLTRLAALRAALA
ncbi:MAG: MurR/RpiR family transcriptional regulator [Rhodospirillales bacterium]|nr:MurR/RpiR family transcriptional regulator [Rhodospirillales bacterium]